MVVRELITLLEDLEREEMKIWGDQKSIEIMFDYFGPFSGTSEFCYGGLVSDARIERTPDGVYPVLTAVK